MYRCGPCAGGSHQPPPRTSGEAGPLAPSHGRTHQVPYTASKPCCAFRAPSARGPLTSCESCAATLLTRRGQRPAPPVALRVARSWPSTYPRAHRECLAGHFAVFSMTFRKTQQVLCRRIRNPSGTRFLEQAFQRGPRGPPLSCPVTCSVVWDASSPPPRPLFFTIWVTCTQNESLQRLKGRVPGDVRWLIPSTERGSALGAGCPGDSRGGGSSGDSRAWEGSPSLVHAGQGHRRKIIIITAHWTWFCGLFW